VNFLRILLKLLKAARSLRRQLCDEDKRDRVAACLAAKLRIPNEITAETLAR
jgi:hypothetical protein